MTSETQPTFSTAMRGYDRTQVDEYTARLRQLLDEAEQRAAVSNPEGATPSGEGDASRRGSAPDFDALGERIAAMLRLAEEEAADRRHRARQEVEAVLGRAHDEAAEIRRVAESDVQDLRNSRAEAQAEAKGILDAAREQAEDLLGRARRHAEDQAEGIIAQAEADARRILDEAHESARMRLEEADARREELRSETEALEERHRRILDDLARVRAALDGDYVAPRPGQPGDGTRLEEETVGP
jgi:DivIVA domain-containing protein